MPHRVTVKKLSKDTNERKALFRNLTTDIILHEKVKTTQAKAKMIRTIIERVITKAKNGRVIDRRFIASFLTSEDAYKKLLEDLVVRFQDRKSGYVRIVKLGPRRGDNAPIVRIELTEKPKVEEKKKKGEKDTKKEAISTKGEKESKNQDSKKK